MRKNWSGGWVRGVAAMIALGALLALPAPASSYIAQLKRYPYLTDTVGTSATVNWGTDRSSINSAVKWGKVGTESCTAHTTAGTRTAITVNGVSEYQWEAQLTGLQQDAQYCYRVFFNVNFTTDLLGTDSSPIFRTQLPAGSTQPFRFAVFGDWGKVDSSGQNQDQANVMSQIAASGARFAVTTGDNAYDVGSQKDYGDLYQVGAATSEVFGPNFWKVPGASIPVFPVLGNHDHNNSVLLTNWPQDTAAATSGGRYTTDTYCCLNGTQSSAYPSTWYAFDAGNARFYVLDAAWDDSNSGTADVYKNDYDYHWTPSSDQYQWLANDLATHPRQVKFAFWHFPMYSDNQGEGSDSYLQGSNSLEGLLKLYDVTLGFSGHAHSYQRFNAPAGGIPTYATGGGGATLDPIGTEGCSPLDAYALGWSNSSLGSACGSAPIPASKDRVHHFLAVDVNGSNVTVTPTDELGRTFDQVTYTVSPSNADLSITKADSPDPVLAGQQLTYTLTVHNQGPSTAIATQVTDNLPAGVTFVSATPSQGSCGQASGTVNCTLGTLASGANATVDVKVTPQSAGSLTNQASVSSSVADSNSVNNSASAGTTVNPAADLSLTKTDSPDPVLAGQLLTYTLTAANAGPSSATGVQVTDNLPAGTTFDSATASQGSCSQSAGTVTCSLGTIASGGNATATIKIRPLDSGSITNQASISSAVTDPTPGNNSASADTTVNPVAGLSLAKSDAPDPVLVGQLLTYTLTALNAGPQGATGVQITDNLPASVTYDSATPSQGSCSQASGTVSCSLGTLSASQSATVQIKVRPQVTGSITNQASVTSDLPDGDPSDNVASADTTVSPAANLSVTKSDSPDPVLAGQLLTYTLTAHNAGPSTASAVQVTDNLPGGTTFDSANPSQGTCQESSGTVTCALGTMTSGATATVLVKVIRQATGSITNQANISSDTADPDWTDNIALEATTVNPAADLALTKTGEPDPVLVGQQLTYTLEVVNTGPQDADNVSLTDNLPSGVTFNSATPSQGTCSQASGTVSCSIGTVANAATASVDIKVTPQATGQLNNQASVQSTVADPGAANNSASVTTTVNPVADISVTKSDSPDPVPVGQQLTYTLGVHNAGPSTATGVQVSDSLPANVTFDSATPSQGSCQQASGTVTCALGTLASGQDATVDVKVRPQAEGQITNQASVLSDAFDPSTSNNSASAGTTVSPAADLSLTKADSPDPVLEGDLLTYTLTVHNAGPSSATGVQVNDTLPQNVTYDSATPSQGTCLQSLGVVTCALGSLASGQDATVAVKVRPQATGSITNQASVSSDFFDPSTANNSASAGTTVNPAIALSIANADSPDPVPAGQPLTYTLTISNAGPESATGVQVTDTLPANVTFDSATPSQGTCQQASGTVTCSLGSLGVAQQATVQIAVHPQAAGQITNQASVSADQGEVNTSDNSASQTTTVDPAADLSLTKSDSPDPVLEGQLLTYTLTVHNSGPSGAGQAQVTDTLPANVTFDSVTQSQGSCQQSSGTVTCNLGAVSNGADATVTVKVRPQATGSITNQASVSGDVFDPSATNNSASADTTVNHAADLSLTKSDSPDPVLAGQLITYTLTAHNAGPSDATSVQVTDPLPQNATFDSVTPSQGTCQLSSGTVTCSLGTITSGQNATIDLKVKTQGPGQVTNQAGVSSAVGDPNSADNSASATTTVSSLGGFPRPKGATPLRASLTVAYTPCTSPNRQHGAPLAALSCNPPTQTSSNLTVGTLDANGVPANAVGSVRLDTHVGAPGPPDDSDVNITTGLTDIRCKAAIAACGPANAGAGADYVGEVRASMSLRLTDRLNGTTPAGGTEAGTVQDSQFAFNVPCIATTNTAIGAQCSITTSANTVMPGLVKDNARSLWQLGSIQVFDGGADGQGLTTGDNQLFMDQGVFTP